MATAKSERYEIDRDGGTPQKNSGRGSLHKGDSTLSIFNVDIKEYSKSFSISKSVWFKLTSDAIQSGNYEPALKIVLGSGSEPRLRLFVVNEDIIKDYIRLLEAEQGEQ